jgi:hypothetical protein
MKPTLKLHTNHFPVLSEPKRGHLNLISDNGVSTGSTPIRILSLVNDFKVKINQASPQELSTVQLQVTGSLLTAEEKMSLLKLIYNNRIEKTGRKIVLFKAPVIPARKSS